MTIDKHVITLVVLTPECSPDTVIKRVEEVARADERIEGTVTREARALTPFQRVPDPPTPPTPYTDAGVAAHDQALDDWRDQLPTIDTFREDGRA